MNRRDALLCLLALPAARRAYGQSAEKMYRVGIVYSLTPVADVTGPEPVHPPTRSFLQGLRALGYAEGKNLIFDPVSANGRRERIPELVAELLRRKPDVLVVTGSEIAVAAKQASSTVPIVMASVSQPVKNGLLASFAHPGGNVTGLAVDVSAQTEAKRLELLKAVAPKVSRVTCLATKWVWDGPIGQAAREGAPALGIKLLYAEHTPNDLKATFATVIRQRPDALLVALSPDVYPQRKQIAEFALNARLPGIYPFFEMVEAGGLMSYGVSLSDLWRRAAGYVDKILKGANPGNLPVEQPTKFELVVNVKTARALGLTISQTILARADRVIE